MTRKVLYEKIESFLASKIAQGCSPETIRAYRYEVAYFLKMETEFTLNCVEAFIAKHPHLSPASLARKIAVLKAFSGWLFDRGHADADVLARMKTPRPRKRTVSYLTEFEFQKLLKTIRQEESKGFTLKGRDYAILALFVGTGLRLSELRNLQLRDLDLNKKTLAIKRKGGNIQKIPVCESAIQALYRWLSTRKKMDLPPALPWLFVSNRRRQMSGQTIRDVVKNWMARAGIQKEKMAPHTLRHTFATFLCKTVPVNVVSELLGHASLNTTMRYLHVDSEDQKIAVNMVRF